MAVPLPRRLYSVAATRRLARRALPPALFDFIDGGAEDERTMRANEAAFAAVEIMPRPLQGTARRDQRLTLFGREITMPLIVGPTGLSGLFWPDGELATARAAAAAGVPFCLSHGSTCTIEELAASGAAPRWMQVFMFKDRGMTRSFTERARTSGYDALVLTTDNQVLGNRERDLRNGFAIPPKLTPKTLLGMARRPGWLWRMRGRHDLSFANYAEAGGDLRAIAGRMSALLDPSASWSDVAWLRSLWPGPLLLKGILHPDEARRAIAEGIDGIVVSNHGGRQLDGAPATAAVLPTIARAVDGRIPILVDGGIRRGTDLARARALGATACMIGRPHLWALAVAGEAGVAAILDLYRRELDRVMALCGFDDLAAIDASALVPA
ncbi:MAG: alpha-hydroxy acid oxidase [Geminicoccaceae bacterium]